jgi:hypothetical protein
MKNKKLNSLLSYFFSLLALLLTTGTSPALAQANFPEKPVAHRCTLSTRGWNRYRCARARRRDGNRTKPKCHY